MKTLTDEQLMSRLQDGDKDALGLLIDRYEGTIFTFCCSYCKWDAVTANEMMQNIFVRVYDKRALYKREMAFRPWLFKLARNQVFNDLKRMQRETKRKVPVPLDLEGSGKRPDEELARKEKSLELDKLVVGLSKQQQDIIRLLRQELSYKEIAGVLDVSEAVVRNNLMRAIRKMRDKDSRYKPSE